MSRRSERGAANILAVLVLTIGGFLVMVAGALFATGIAQRDLIPRLRAKALGLADRAQGKSSSAAPVDSARVSSPEDSLRALLSQIETQRTLLESEREELSAMRGDIDSVLVRFRETQSKEALRQAKLLSAMKPDEAAGILARMDDASMHAVLLRMSNKAASKVMTKLDPDRLARLSMEELGVDAMSEVRASEQDPSIEPSPMQEGGR